MIKAMSCWTESQPKTAGAFACWRRPLNVLLAGVALLLLSPVLLVIGVLIKLTSRGPVFYSQTRIGLGGRRFKVYKFRTMRQDAESNGKAQWAGTGDKRVTLAGEALRRLVNDGDAVDAGTRGCLMLPLTANGCANERITTQRHRTAPDVLLTAPDAFQDGRNDTRPHSPISRSGAF